MHVIPNGFRCVYSVIGIGRTKRVNEKKKNLAKHLQIILLLQSIAFLNLFYI